MELDLQKIIKESSEYLRAEGTCVCEDCGKEYKQHPIDGTFIWLTRICTGELVNCE